MRTNLDPIKQEVTDYYLQGHSLIETATHFGIAEGSVSNILIRQGIPRRSRSEGNKLKWTPDKRKKQSNALIGNSRTLGKAWIYNKVVHRPSLRGDRNPSWRGGKTPLRLAIREYPEYVQWRKAVFERDNYTCTRCNAQCCEGNKVILNADHITPLALILRQYNVSSKEDALACAAIWNISNGRTFCKTCHRLTDTYGVNSVHYKVLE
jgi:5-methylcytosine-specific restriction endonuclease McrA